MMRAGTALAVLVPFAVALSAALVVPVSRAADSTAVLVAPTVTTQPDIAVVPREGFTATFTAAATGAPTPTVIWQVANDRNGPWRTLQGTTSTTLSFTATTAAFGHAYRAVFTNTLGTATTRPAKLVSRVNWMHDLGSDISNIPLTELTIPGSHDMGTYTLPGDVRSTDYQASACVVIPDAICDSYARAQSRNATTELNDGIRYFDLRVCGKGNLPTSPWPPDYATMSADPVACHGLIGARLKDILTQTRNWVQNHPKELVFLDFNHHFQIDQYMEGQLIDSTLTYTDGRSMLIPPQYCTPDDPNSGTCAAGLTLADVGPDKLGNIIVNFENDGAPGKTVSDQFNRDYDIQPILRYDFYDHHPAFWGRTDEPPHGGAHCTTAAAFASCFGNTDTDADALTYAKGGTSTRQSFAEPHPAYTFEHFFVQFLQTTPDGTYMAKHPDGSLLDMAMRSNPVVGPGFFGCGEWGVSDCFAQRLPENVNIVALNFYERTQYGSALFHNQVTFDFVHEVIKFDAYARTAPVVTITTQAKRAASGWYNAAALGGKGATLPLSVSATDYRYPTGLGALDCTDVATNLPLSGLPAETADTTETGSATLSDGIHQLDCRATDGANEGTHQQGNHGFGPGSTGMPMRVPVDTTPPTIHCPTGKLTLNQPVTSLTATVSDAVSGPTVSSIAMPVSTSTLGTRSVSLNTTDKAGNSVTTACAYTVSYAIALGYDAKQPVTSGQPVPITVFVRDYSGANVSKVSLAARYVISAATCPPGTIGGCPHPQLPPTRYGTTRGTLFTPLSSGGYEYDLATMKGFPSVTPTPIYQPGPYKLVFVVNGDPALHSAPFIINAPAR